MADAGYGPEAVRSVEDAMMGRGVPNPRDMRPHDLVGRFGMVNTRLLAAACAVQTLADAEALLFLERSFEELLNQLRAWRGAGGGALGEGERRVFVRL